jgi:hypothetical protein
MQQGWPFEMAIMDTIYFEADLAISRLKGMINRRRAKTGISHWNMSREDRFQVVHQLAQGLALMKDPERLFGPRWKAIFFTKKEREVVERAVMLRRLGGHWAALAKEYQDSGISPEMYLDFIETQWFSSIVKGEIIQGPCTGSSLAEAESLRKSHTFLPE